MSWLIGKVANLEIQHQGITWAKILVFVSAVVLFILVRKPISGKTAYFGSIVFAPLVTLSTLVFGFLGVAILTLFCSVVFPKSIVTKQDDYTIYSTEVSFMKRPEKFEITRKTGVLFERKLGKFDSGFYSEFKDASVAETEKTVVLRFKTEDYDTDPVGVKDTVIVVQKPIR